MAARPGARSPSSPARRAATPTFSRADSAFLLATTSGWRLTAMGPLTRFGAKDRTTSRPGRSGTPGDDRLSRAENRRQIADGNGQVPHLRGPGISGLSLQLHSANKLRDPPDVMIVAPVPETVDNLFRGARIPVAGGADLHGGGSGEHELDDVGGC